jgi:NAD(P)-dependent dehydrogenase (short-subunit alcohol dehydrogenase family)
MNEWLGKVVLITGAGSGIGKASAIAFANSGAKVVLVGRRELELQKVTEIVRELSTEALVIPADVSKEQEVMAMVTEIENKFYRLDVAFNNAGTEGVFAPIEQLTETDFEATINTNLKGVWLCCKHVIKSMREKGNGGVIINTSSWLSRGGFAGSSLYSASKAALDGMIRALVQETSVDNIRINNINPGIIDTPMFRRFADDTAAKPFIEHTPMRRLGTADEIADFVVALSSHASRFVTGQSILVDGGYTIPGHRGWLSGDVNIGVQQ